MKHLALGGYTIPLHEQAIRAMRAGVRKAIEDLRQQGVPVYVWEDNKVVELRPHKRANSRPRSRPRTSRKPY